MSRHNIQFRGIRHSPSDITGQDGDLLECVNLVHENGELKPIEIPEKTTVQGYTSETLSAVHNCNDGIKYVFTGYDTSNDISWIRIKDDSTSHDIVQIGGYDQHNISGEKIQWVDVVGNTLIVGTDKSTHYALYKNGEYKWLGDKIPQPVFWFDFRRAAKTEAGYWLKRYDPKTNTMTPSGDYLPGGGVAMSGTSGYVRENYEYDQARLANTTDENLKLFRDGIRSRVEQVISTAKSNNVFIFPFFIRYAVRLYDGNYVMHSSPLLMIPSSLKCPLLSFLKMEGNNGFIAEYTDSGSLVSYIATDVMDFRGMELQLQFVGFRKDDGTPGTIDDWSDIVKGVDISLSSQIRSYNERGWDDLSSVPKSFYCYMKKVYDGTGYVDDPSVREYGHCYTQNFNIDWWDIFTDNGTDAFVHDDKLQNNPSSPYNVYKYLKVPLPEFSEKEMMKKIEETSLFYRVLQYDLSELKTGLWATARQFKNEVEQGTLERLETLPLLPDDYVSRCRMTGGVNYTYNQRLLFGNIELQAPLWYTDEKTFGSDNYDGSVYFRIEKPEKTIWVKWDFEDIGRFDFGHFLFYPDVNCKEAVLAIQGETWRSVPMKEHTGLNGAYALMPGIKSLYESRTGFVVPSYPSLPSESTDRYYSLHNVIAMSNAANPFYFKANNFQNIGRTKVVGIATNTLDVSFNQWGPYSIYVFCNDGIVTVPIDKEGDFTGAVEAISPDVLIEPEKLSRPTLIQTGQMLMFITQRGVMSIAGTRINCVSDVMNGRHFNPLTDLAPVNSVSYNIGAFKGMADLSSDDTAFRDFARTGFLAFDYAHNRVLLLNASQDTGGNYLYRYHYVYNLGNGMWSKQLIYNNGSVFQLAAIPDNSAPATPPSTVLDVPVITAAVNNYTEMFLQDNGGWLYRTMEVAEENDASSLYQYGYFVSRPVRFGTDEYKAIQRMLHRHTHYADSSFVKVQVYGSRDGVMYGRVNTLRGMSYQYFIFVVYTYLKPNERYSYLTVDFETRLTNKLR